MTWVRIDDIFHDDPRIVEGGPVAAGFVALSLSYANRNLTDCWVPSAFVRQRASTLPDGDEVIDRMTELGIWKPFRRNGLEGFQVHSDFAGLQPTRAQVEAKRAQRSEAGRTGGQRSGFVRRERTTDEATRERPGSSSEANVKRIASTLPKQIGGTHESRSEGHLNPDPDPDPDPFSDPDPDPEAKIRTERARKGEQEEGVGGTIGGNLTSASRRGGGWTSTSELARTFGRGR